MWGVFVVLLWIVGIIVGLVVLYLAFMVAGTIFTLIVGNKPRGIEVEVDSRPSCRAGDEISLVVRVRDTLGRARRLSNVDISATYLKGLVITRVEPEPAERASEPTLGVYIHRMDRPLAANGTETVKFLLHAAAEGDYAGEVTVYVDGSNFRYISKAIRTVVSGER